MENKKVDSQIDTNTNTKVEINKEPNNITEQFCSCCKPVDFFDFLNNKNKDMLCVDIFSNKLSPEIGHENSIKKTHPIFIKNNSLNSK
jgi:hypothetical protein